MPLDELSRRYAEELLTNDLERITQEHQEKREQATAEASSRGFLLSGRHVAAIGSLQAEMVVQLMRARVNTLLKAYEKARIPFDDNTRNEITNEVSGYGATQKGHAIAAVSQFVSQTFGGVGPPNMMQAVGQQIERTINIGMAEITRELRIKGYETALDARQAGKIYAAGLGKKWDVFISHASEDKDEFVRPLAKVLEESGLSVWFDEFTLKVGDSLRKSIDHGIANSRFGIIVLSLSFFSKPWPQGELDGFFSREIEGVKVILPVWHKIRAEEVKQYSPMLAGRFAANSINGVDVVANQLREAMGVSSKSVGA